MAQAAQELDLDVASTHGMKRTISAKIARACQKCRAPGAWQKIEPDLSKLSVQERRIYEWRMQNWPEVFVQDERVNQMIEDSCPCCSTPRSKIEDLGVIGEMEI